MPHHTPERLDELQAAYFRWAKLNKTRALKHRVKRNAWLARHARERHVVTAAAIALL